LSFGLTREEIEYAFPGGHWVLYRSNDWVEYVWENYVLYFPTSQHSEFYNRFIIHAWNKHRPPSSNYVSLDEFFKAENIDMFTYHIRRAVGNAT
jgi:hypothetical protein